MKYQACQSFYHFFTKNIIPSVIQEHECYSTYDFQQCGILTIVDSDEHVLPPVNLVTSNDIRSVA